MQIKKFVAIGLLTMIIWAIPSLAQISKSPLLGTFPGWGVQAWGDYGVPWSDVIAEAFHFSPDGSFYELQDENTMMKIAVTFDAKQMIEKHKIPIDAGGTVNVILDGIPQPFIIDGIPQPWLSNQHVVMEFDFTPGRHTLVMINNSCPDRFECWGTLVVGKCLWGTDKNITWVKSGLPEPQ